MDLWWQRSEANGNKQCWQFTFFSSRWLQWFSWYYCAGIRSKNVYHSCCKCWEKLWGLWSSLIQEQRDFLLRKISLKNQFLRSLSFSARHVLPVWGKRIVLINKSCSKYLNVRNIGEKDSYLEKWEKRSIVWRAIGNKAYWVILFIGRKIKALVSGSRLLLASRWGGSSFVSMLLQAFRGRDGFAFGGGVKQIHLFTVCGTSEWSSCAMFSMGGCLFASVRAKLNFFASIHSTLCQYLGI